MVAQDIIGWKSLYVNLLPTTTEKNRLVKANEAFVYQLHARAMAPAPARFELMLQTHPRDMPLCKSPLPPPWSEPGTSLEKGEGTRAPGFLLKAGMTFEGDPTGRPYSSTEAAIAKAKPYCRGLI